MNTTDKVAFNVAMIILIVIIFIWWLHTGMFGKG